MFDNQHYVIKPRIKIHFSRADLVNITAAGRCTRRKTSLYIPQVWLRCFKKLFCDNVSFDACTAVLLSLLQKRAVVQPSGLGFPEAFAKGQGRRERCLETAESHKRVLLIACCEWGKLIITKANQSVFSFNSRPNITCNYLFNNNKKDNASSL